MDRFRLSIRGMALLVTAAAVVFAVASQPAALVGVFAGFLSIFAALAMQALFFLMGSAFGRWLGPVDVVARTSRGGIEHSSLARTAARPGAATVATTGEG
jgi:formate hydrogenlyase subunit 3/multisubunit Na+/H+ antiporter MnhD subunit